MKRMMAMLLGLVAVAAGCQTTTSSEPASLPSDIAIAEPAEDVAPEFAAYSGTWRGRWDGSLDSYLVVESVDPPNATVVYSWGTSRLVPEAGWLRRTAQFEDGILNVDMNPGKRATFAMREDGNLDATFFDGEDDTVTPAVFSRVE